MAQYLLIEQLDVPPSVPVSPTLIKLTDAETELSETEVVRAYRDQIKVGSVVHFIDLDKSSKYRVDLTTRKVS